MINKYGSAVIWEYKVIIFATCRRIHVGYFSCRFIEFSLGCTLQNFRYYDFQKATASTVFHSISLKVCDYASHGGMQLITFWRSDKS